MTQTLKQWWKEDSLGRYLLVGGLVYALFVSQGVPLWDDDFTSWFWKIKDNSLFHYIFEWLSPISTQPQHWGFNERPLQIIVYKICQMISGYNAWSYFLYKSVVYSLIGVMIYNWGRRLMPESLRTGERKSRGNLASAAAAIFFVILPGPLAAHILHQDFAPTSQLIILTLTYFIWDGVEKTPLSWTGMPDFKNAEHVQWLKRWSVLAVLTYLGYKAKADVKLIPLILASYVFLVRRHQWKFFAFPVALMLVLAVPYGPGIFTKLPPFVPGSKGSEIGWMWQPASFDRFLEFVWRRDDYNVVGALREPTISLAGLLGPYLLLPLLGFLGWRMEAFDKVPWLRQTTQQDRARTFVLLWLGAVLVATSALPAINYTFRIRYGIMHMVPACILLAWVFGLFAESLERIPRWAAYAAMAGLIIQSGINLNRSLAYRRDMGTVMVSVDQAYEKIARDLPDSKLALMPDFRPYDYRPEAPKLFVEKVTLGSPAELAKFPAQKTITVSWNPSLWEQLELVEHFSGCRSTTVFDWVYPCVQGQGTYVMRYIGLDADYRKGEELRGAGKIAEARTYHEKFLSHYPGSLAANFVIGLESYQLKDWARSQSAYGKLELYFPEHHGIMYNHALALAELGRHKEAISRLKYIAAKEPENYPVLINLYYAYQKNNQPSQAKELLVNMKRKFPNDGEINRLIANTSS